MSQENLEKIIAQQATTIQNLTDEIKLLREQVAYLTQKRYGKSSEQMPLSGQLNLFEGLPGKKRIIVYPGSDHISNMLISAYTAAVKT
ncbi:transposase [Lactobacillus amylovorus]|uniref:transposase n=1 Tax=Lactobacillus amylovorus TaxID=1604 RepID=UPI002330C9FC|nr:transposase [Lactobacillus amylovorus]